MRKKDLEAIPLPDPPEELIATAQNDRYEAREVKDWNGRLRKEKSYITDLYFSAAEAGGTLIVQMWTRRQLAKGDYEPKAVVYIDWKTSRKRSRPGTGMQLSALRKALRRRCGRSETPEGKSRENHAHMQLRETDQQPQKSVPQMHVAGGTEEGGNEDQAQGNKNLQ